MGVVIVVVSLNQSEHAKLPAFEGSDSDNDGGVAPSQSDHVKPPASEGSNGPKKVGSLSRQRSLDTKDSSSLMVPLPLLSHSTGVFGCPGDRTVGDRVD